MSLQMKLSNLKRQDEQDKKGSKEIKNSREFFKKPGDDAEFEKKKKKKKKMTEDLFKVLEHTKTDNPHVPPTVQDAETIEEETKKATNDFIKTDL